MAAADDAPMKAVQVKLVLLGEAAVGKSSLVLRFVQNDFNENTSPTIGAAFLTQKCRLESRIVKFEIWDTAGQERFHSLAPMYYRNAAAAVVVYDITKAASLEKAKSWVKELQRQANPNIIIALVGNKVDLVSDKDAETASPKTPTAVSASASESEDADADDVVESTEVDRKAKVPEEDEEEDEDASPPPPSASTSGNFAARGGDEANSRQVSTAEAEAYAKECGLLFFEASAKTGMNVGEVFTEIAKTIPLDTIAPKAPAGNKRTPAGQQPERVELNEGQQAKKGGCC